MTRTKLELQTAPNSAIGPMGRILDQWETFAREVEKCLNPKKEDELILWRLTYNWHQETAEEFEVREMPPVPQVFGTVSLIRRDTRWEIGLCPYIFQFEGWTGSGALAFDMKRKMVCSDDEKLVKEIAKWLKNEYIYSSIITAS